MAVIQETLSLRERTLKGVPMASLLFLPRSVTKWEALAALPPLPQTKIWRPARCASRSVRMSGAISSTLMESRARFCSAMYCLSQSSMVRKMRGALARVEPYARGAERKSERGFPKPRLPRQR